MENTENFSTIPEKICPTENQKNLLQEETCESILGQYSQEKIDRINKIIEKGYTTSEANLLIHHEITDKTGRKITFEEIEQKYKTAISNRLTPSKFARIWLLSNDLELVGLTVVALKSLETKTFSFFTDFENENLTAIINLSSKYTKNILIKDLIIALNSKDPNLKLHFIDILRKKNVPATEILRLCRITLDPDQAIRIKKFNDKFKLGLFDDDERTYKKILPLIDYLEANCKDQNDLNFFYHLLQDKFEKNYQPSRKHNNFKLNEIFDFEDLKKDESLKWCLKINQIIFNPELSLRIGRTIYLDGNTSFEDLDHMTSKELEKIYIEIENTINENANLTIYKGRNILILNNNEKYFDNTNHFLKKNDLNNLEKKSGKKSLQVVNAEEKLTEDELEKKRDEFLNKLLNTPPPMTFIFTGHGLPEKLFFDNNDGYINVDKLAETIDKRGELYKDANLLSKDIYIFDSCFNHSFIRNLYDKIQNKEILPITTGPSEYGSVSFYEKEQSNLSTIYDVSNPNLTIGAIASNEDKTINSTNLTIFIPKKGKPIQVVENTPVDKREVVL